MLTTFYRIVITLGFVLLQNSLCSVEYYSATTELNRAFEVGQQLAADLDTYLDIEESRLNRIRQVAKRLSINGFEANLTGEPEDFFGNPVNAYLTIKRLAVNWKSDLLSLLDGAEAERHQTEEDSSNYESLSADRQQLAEVRARVEHSASMLPGNNDVTGAADALLLLQKTYKLRAEDIANGKLTDELTCPRLSAAQCMHLGQQAYENQDYLKAEEWFRVAYMRVLEELSSEESQGLTGDDGVERVRRSTQKQLDQDFQIPNEVRPDPLEVLDHLAYSLGRQGRYAEALNVTRLMLENDPDNMHHKRNEEFYHERIRVGEGIVGPAASGPLTGLAEENEIYQALCRGEQIFAPPPSNTLYCRYSVPHPYYLIGPVKEEILYPDPRIVMWYDVIHPSEIQRIQELASPRLRRATVKNPITGELENAFYRTSKSAWLPDSLDEITHRINQRIHALTGLSMESAEDLQVGNYGIGGYYAPHFDFGRKRERDAFEREHGNRIATIIFYMSDVKAGGATAFNRVGAVVNPVRGAAAFWYNLFPNGEGDLRTRHVACPVLVGSKWVMNVWFHEKGQSLHRPCELTQGPVEVDDGF